MSDALNIFDKEKSIQDLKDISKAVDENIIKRYKEIIALSRQATNGFNSGAIRDYAVALKTSGQAGQGLITVTDKLTDAERRLAQVKRNLEIASSKQAQQIALVQEQTRRLTAARREEAKEEERLAALSDRERQRLGAAVSLYRMTEAAMNKLQLEYRNLAVAKKLGMSLTDKETQRMEYLEKRIQRYDQALKAVDASMGNHRRNVGNYASGFNSLNNSVAQLTREMPAFAQSAQIGFLALSNNIPIFFDSIKAAKEQNAALRAEGKAQIPVWQQVGKAFFSWNTILSVAVTLLTIYGAELWKTTKALLAGNSATEILEKNTKDLNQARKEGVKSAASEINKLETLYRVATNENASREARIRSVNKLQSLYPSFFKNLSDEAIMVGNASTKYLELRNAILDSARARAIGNILEKRQEEQLLKEEELRNRLNKVLEERRKLQKNINNSQTEYVRDNQGGLILKEVENSELLKRNTNLAYGYILEIGKSRRASNKENKALLDEQFNLENKKNVLNLEGDRLGKGAGVTKTKQYSGAKLTGEQKDYLNSLQAEKDNAIAIQKEKLLNLEIDEVEYWKNYIDIVQKYRKSIQDYLKGSNAKERQIEASVRKRAIDELSNSYNELYDLEKEKLEETFNMQINALERQSKELEKADYFSDSERLKKQIEIDSELIGQTNDFYQEQIELARNAGKSVLELERKRDEEIGKIQDSREDKMRSMFDAFKSDIEKQTEFNSVFENRTYEQQKGLILSNKSLSNDEREYQLSLLDIDNQIKLNELKIAELKTLKAQYDTRIAIASVTGIINPEDVKNSVELEASIQNILNTILELNNKAKDIVSEKQRITNNIISQGFSDLGFNGLADAYSKTMERLKNKTLEWKDYAILASAAVLDALSNLSNQQKERTIANLNEQLKVSQENTEQEIGFINQRLEWLNNLDEMSKEQITERNRLEDEARTLKEQQQQREKLIEAQKARAEQRAAAQQAIINGLLAATTTLAQLGIPAGIIPAAIAAGFGVANAALIMAKDPVPQYFVGRERGPAEYAWTQEKGREIITDKNDNIKSLGSDKGPQMTWLEAGDKVLTADRTKEVLKRMGSLPKLGEKVFRKAVMQSLTAPVIVNTKTEDNSTKIAEEVGRQLQKAFAKYDKPQIIKEKGKIKKYSGANLPVIIGEYDLKTGEEIWYQ